MVEKQLPPGFDLGEDEQLPTGFRILFPDKGVNLTKITETPGKMILPLVRMRIIDAAYDTKRKESLMELFVREFDDRMISRDRKGRIEAVQMFNRILAGSEDEDEAVL